MRTRLAIKTNALLERFFPERRLFLRSDTDTRFIRLRPATQAIAFVGASTTLAWTIVATAILLMNSIGAGNFREQARREQQTYQQRLNALSEERDARAADALTAQERFNAALVQISQMQSELLESETRRQELSTGIDVIQSTLREAMSDRKAIGQRLATLEAQIETGALTGDQDPEAETTMMMMNAALARAALERDQVIADAQAALVRAAEVESELELVEDNTDRIFQQIEEAMTVSVMPLNKMFKEAGMDPENILSQVRRSYAGEGGPIMPLRFSTRSEVLAPETERANRILNQMDRLNLYRIAAEKAPFASPLKDPFRFTSGFGYRWGRLHAGTDFAAPHGTPIYSTADGVVISAGWSTSYGRLVKIQHEFGIETRYAHMSKINVKVGQRVSRGDLVGAMGNTGRSTGTHLHYEVRVGGKPVNPMIYIEAANDVF